MYSYYKNERLKERLSRWMRFISVYKMRIQDGLSRWMKSVGMSRRDEFREGLGSSRVRHICIFCAKGVLKMGEDKSYFCIVITKMSVSKMRRAKKNASWTYRRDV